MRKALILGNDTRAFLSVVRSLGRAGIQVHVGWCGTDGDALQSRYIARIHALPAYSEASDDWKTALIALLREQSFDLVIPCSDETLIPLQKHRDELGQYARLYVLNDAAYQTLFDKIKTNELARSVGVNLPAEEIVVSSEQLARIKERFELPVVLKPRASFEANNLHSKRLVQKAYTWAACEESAREMLAHGPVAVQENFIGIGVGVELLLQNGDMVMAFQHERVHEPLHGGGSSYRRSRPLSPDLLDAALRLLRPMQYTGVAMVEFKVNPRTGKWIFIEVNARFWGSLPLAIAAGADFPLALFNLLVENTRPTARPYRIAVHCRSISRDLKWQIDNLRADHSDPTLATRSVLRVVSDAVVNTLAFRERFDTLTLDDPQPGLAEIGGLIRRGVSGVSRGSLRFFQNQPPVRRYLARRAQRALAQAQSVLFVCKGNICRSPFAERIARTQLTGKRISSAGYYPKEDRRSPDIAAAAARDWKIDLDPHRSRRVTNELVDDADIIFVFDSQNLVRLARDYPSIRHKLFLVGALRSNGPLTIEDPWGGDLTRFQQIYGQIADALAGPPKPTPEPRRASLTPVSGVAGR